MIDRTSGWERTNLGQVVDVLDSERVPVNAKERAKRPGPVPYYGATGQVGWIDKPLFDEELLLLGEDGAPFLDADKPKAYIIKGPSWANNHAHVLRALSGITSNGFLKYALDLVDYRPHVNGTTRLKLTQKAMKAIPIPLPPLEEQERIVAAIEEKLTRLDDAKASLDHASARLRGLSSKLEESILVNAPEVPLGSIAVEARYGTSQKCTYDGTGPPVVRIPNVVAGRLDLSDLKSAIDPHGVSGDVMLQSGDLLFVRTNGSRDLIGRAAVADETRDLAFASYLIRFRLPPGVDPQYVSAVVSAPSKRRELEAMAATSAGQYNLSISKLSSLSVPLPPLEEQRRVVEAKADRNEALDRLRGSIDSGAKRAGALRRAILAAALGGQLVPQSSDAESSSAPSSTLACSEAVCSQGTAGEAQRD